MTTLELRDVHVTYPTPVGEVHALAAVDLQLPPGEFVSVVGSNGAGKSTLVNVIAGSTEATRGRVVLGGIPLDGIPEHRRARRIARVFQDTGNSVCPELTIHENFVLALTRRRRRSPFRLVGSTSRTKKAAEILDGYGTGLCARLHQPTGLLSGGQRQLVGLVMAVVAEPEVLLLDEHTSALDPAMAEQVMLATDEAVRDRRLTTLMITHNLVHAARFGDRLLIMAGGRIVDQIAEEEPERRDETALVARFRAAAGAVSDRMLA
jgi:putative tryptophan/tyrosine transport system ATP-binding protein